MEENKRTPAIRFRGFADEWEERKLGELIHLNGRIGFRGYTEKDIISKSDGGVLTFSPTNIIDNQLTTACKNTYITRFKYNESPEIKIHNGDILFVKTGSTLGKSALVANLREDATLNPQLVVIRPIKLKSIFLSILLTTQSIANQVRSSKIGGAIPTLTETKIKKFHVILPLNEAEMRKIGTFFHTLDNLISLHQKKHVQLMTIKKTMLEKMFPKEGETVPEIRFAGFSKSWKSIQLCDIIKEVTRNDPLSSAPIMMITANQGFIPQSERYAFNNAGESLKKYTLLYQGELAYNHGASKLRPYGSCFNLSNVKEARIPYVYHCFSAENQNPEFMSITLNGINVENQLRRIVSSGARMDGLLNISFDEYASITLLLPTISEQNAIAKYFHNLDNLITLQQKKIDKLQHIKKAFLDKMFV